MATAYVSPAGSAAYPGTVGAPTSLATALSSAGAGDTVYLAPGSYRGTFTLGVSGTAGNVIQFIGDPKSTQGIAGIAAGIVRITNYLADNTNPADAVSFTATSRSYWSFSGIYFEGFRATGNTAISLTTCSNFSYDKCVFVYGRSNAFNITTSAGVAINASFTKCAFMVQNNGWSVQLVSPNHSSDYNLNVSFSDCTANSALVFIHTAFTNTNANGVTVYNCFTQRKEGVQAYTTNATHPTYIYNSVLYNPSGFAIYVQGGAANSVIENYNLVYGSTTGVTTAGANSFYAGSSGIDFGYSAINQLAGPLVNGPFLGSRLVSAGVLSGAPLTDMYGTTWLTPSTPTMGAVEFATIAGEYLPTERNASTITIAPGSTSQSIELYLGATGLTASTSGLSARYNRTRTASVNIPLVARTIAQAWISGGFAEVDATNMPGVYRLDVPDAALAAGADDVTIVVRGASGTNGAVMTVKLSSGGLTEAQTASAVWGASPAGYNDGTTFGGVVNETNTLANSIETMVQDVPSNVWEEMRATHTTAGTFGEYVNAELVTPVTSAALVRMGPFEVKADGLGASDPLDIQKGAQHGVDIQCVDGNGNGIDITSATVTAKVYNSGGTLVDTYACTATYAADGRATFAIDTTVTNVVGTYTVTVTRTTGASDTQVFGPLRIYVRDI